VPSARILTTALLALALTVLGLATIGSMRFSVKRLEVDRTRRLLGAAEVMVVALVDLDPYLVDPAESAEAERRLDRMVDALGLSEASIVEVGDRVLVSTSPLARAGQVEATTLAAPKEAALAWEGKASVSEALGDGALQAAFAPWADEEGEVATVVVALAGREDLAELGRVRDTFPWIMAGALVLAGLLLAGARSAAQRARKAEADLEHSRRLGVAGQVAAGVVHEVRNPLGTMRSTLEYLRDQAGEENPDRELYDDALEEADRIADTLERFLSLARDTPPEPAYVQVDEVLTTLQRLAQKDLARRGFALERAAQEEPATLFVDPQGLRQAILNLVLNARAALEHAGRSKGTVTLMTTPSEDGRLRITVRDDGPGFPEEILAEPFQAFRSGRPDGTGLGLVLVQRFARAAGGEARVENLEGGGAAVHLDLPMAPGEEAHG
jgi:signal transduction histidine kinase